MANAEAASAAAGPRYAPDDPTLPKPWKGLIDGSTGLTYYWNPETNITQYEKPAGSVPPLPSAVPPVETASQSAPQHGQTGEVSQYQQQYMNHLSQQQGQFQSSVSGQVPQQQPSQIPPTGQQGSHLAQYYTHFGQGMHERGSQVGQSPMQQAQITQQHYGPQMGQQTGQHMLSQQGSHVAQQPVQHPSQLGPQASQQQSPPVGQSQNHHFMPQQMHYAPYHQPMLPHGQPNAQPHSQHMPQGPHFSYQQDSRNGLPHRDDSDYPKINQPGMSMSQVDQNVRAVGQSPPPSMSSSNPALQGSPLAGQPQPFGSSAHMHQPPLSMKLQENRSDMFHSQHTPKFQNQMGQSMMHVQQHGPSPVRRNIGYDENQQVRGGQGFHFNAENESPARAAQHSNLAAIPMARNQQDMRIGAFPHQNAPSARDGTLNPGATHGMHSMINHANVDLPVPNQAYMRPSSIMPGASDAMNMPSVDAYRLEHEVTATGGDVPAPYMTFEAAGFSPEILRELRSAGFASPTPIQAQTWPIARLNRDIVAVAKTGSGKTLGYLMPAFMHLKEKRNNPRYGPTVLVLAPTRELATQIQVEAIKFGKSSRVVCACLYGGAQKGPQLEELRRGVDIVVATPGRLNDILESKQIDLRQVSLLVLDEADRMLDMGFEPQIRKVVNEIPPRRQTLMYTATWPKEVRKIASDLLHNPVQVNIGSVDELAANKSITQYIEVVPQMEKQRRLEQILRAQERGSKVIIFCSTKRMCDDLARNIRRNFPTAVIHGDKNQGERDYVLNQFRSGESPILVATDVAARGLDVKDIRVVINYDFPTGIEDYVHRIGRTGRAGNTGVAYTFLSEQDWKHAADLVKVLEGAEQPVPPEVRDMALRGGPPFGRSGMNNRFDSGPNFGGSRWDSGGRGGGMRDGGFGGRGGMRDGGFGFRGGPRDGGFAGRGMRDGAAMNSRGGRSDFGGRGNRGRGFGPPGGGYGGRPRDDYVSHDRLNSRDGFGRGRGRGRFDNRRDGPGRSRGRSYSSSPEKVSTWDRSSRSRSRSRSRSYSRSRSPRRSYSRSRSPRRSYSRSRSPRRSYSRSRSRSYDRSRGRSRSRSYDRHERPSRRASGFDKLPETVTLEQKDLTAPVVSPPAELPMTTMGLVVNDNPTMPREEKLDDKEVPGVSGGVDQADQFASGV